MTKTIEINGVTPLKIKNSAYDQERFCRVKNLSENVFFASCENENCTENADGVRRISAGESEIIDTKNYDVLYLNGTGKAEIVTSAYVNSLFNRALKGSESKNDSGVVIDEEKEPDHVDSGWMILKNGSAKENSEYKIDCYDVSLLSQIYIKIDDPECIFNWQTDFNVPIQNPNYNLVGSPIIQGKSGVYNVPEGATWVCFGVKNSDTVTGVYNFHENDSNNGNIPVATAEKVGGVKPDNTTVSVNADGVLSAQKAVDSIQIGGRNYIFNSDFRNGLPNNATSTNIRAEVIRDSFNKNALRLTITDTGNTSWYKMPITFDFPGTYTISFKVKSSVSGVSPSNFACLESTGSGDIEYFYHKTKAFDGEWETISVKKNISKEFVGTIFNITIRPAKTPENYLLYTDFQVEKGNIITDWSPAPEDIQAQIDELKAAIISLGGNV